MNLDKESMKKLRQLIFTKKTGEDSSERRIS